MQSPIAYPNGMILHTTFALLLLGVCIWHFVLRFRPLTRRDVSDRRSLLRLLAVLAGGGLVWAGIEAAQQGLGTAGSRRRFTGSREEPAYLPVTMWMLDNPEPVDSGLYALEVSGNVATPLHLDLDALSRLRRSSMLATLDCTGGWYSTQEWQGVNVGELLALAKPEVNARYVRFRSVTGYRWSLPLAEANNALLATHVAGAPLIHGNGAPVRLVAPGRRGFQWVKWVVAVEVLESPDAGQWAAIFTSGLDGA
jgi:DMSO/TMAO reductase YedYZ molybdopterin-dependent catalytic subunit